jgi:hypothetical protein
MSSDYEKDSEWDVSEVSDFLKSEQSCITPYNEIKTQNYEIHERLSPTRMCGEHLLTKKDYVIQTFNSFNVVEPEQVRIRWEHKKEQVQNLKNPAYKKMILRSFKYKF